MTVKKIGVGMLGYAFMGKTHSFAYKIMPHFFWPPPAVPDLSIIFGRTESKLKEAAENYGFRNYTTDWKSVVKNSDVDLVDNSLPNDMHQEPSIEAIEAGKNVLCEKPLGRNSQEAKLMRDAARKASVKTMVAFNYRFIPAAIMAKEIVKSGRLGRIYHYRARFFTNRLVDPNFPLKWRLLKDRAGSGPISDLGSHSIDLARFILGEVSAVSAATRTFINERPLIGDPAKKGRVTVEDATAAVIEFENGALGTLEISKFVTGRKNYNSFEINGEKGSLMFDMEKINELLFYATEGDAKILFPDKNQTGIRQIWPTGFMIGFSETYIGEIHHFIDAIVNDKKIEPYGASFEDGYKNCVIVDAILKSAKEGKRITIQL